MISTLVLSLLHSLYIIHFCTLSISLRNPNSTNNTQCFQNRLETPANARFPHAQSYYFVVRSLHYQNPLKKEFITTLYSWEESSQGIQAQLSSQRPSDDMSGLGYKNPTALEQQNQVELEHHIK